VPSSPSELIDAAATDAASIPMRPGAAGGRGGAGSPSGASGADGQAGSGGEVISEGMPTTDAGNMMMSAPEGGSSEPPRPQLVALGDRGCSAMNTRCERSAECVSDRCLITMCESVETSCDGPAECCDLACIGGSCKCGNHSASCGATTTPCCAGLYCETGQCATCKPQDESCEGAYQCCGITDCYAGICQCRPSGALCSDQSVCCAGTRCDGGTCKCRSLGEACDESTVCCSGARCRAGTCQPPEPGTEPTSPVLFEPIKAAPFLVACLANDIGASCTSSSDCCSQNCSDGTCVEACRKLGDAAQLDSHCCSRLQADGKCAYAGCGRSGQTCSANQSFCSGSCVNARCAPAP
jgi:hypothetical protein